MSWKAEVLTNDFSGKWVPNGCQYETKEEAEAAVADLKRRWTAVLDTRVVESDLPVNVTWDAKANNAFFIEPENRK